MSAKNKIAAFAIGGSVTTLLAVADVLNKVEPAIRSAGTGGAPLESRLFDAAIIGDEIISGATRGAASLPAGAVGIMAAGFPAFYNWVMGKDGVTAGQMFCRMLGAAAIYGASYGARAISDAYKAYKATRTTTTTP